MVPYLPPPTINHFRSCPLYKIRMDIILNFGYVYLCILSLDLFDKVNFTFFINKCTIVFGRLVVGTLSYPYRERV